jgi:hypothetical protein
MICQWEEMEGEVLKSGREERGRRECVRGRGYLETGDLVKLDAGNNVFAGKTETDTLLSLSSLSSRDIFSTVVGSSHRIENWIANKENKSLSEGTDWLNKISSTKLTANKKPGGEKRKRDGLI